MTPLLPAPKNALYCWPTQFLRGAHFMTNPDDLARAVAADLGSDVLAAMDAPPADTRAFGIPEAAAVAGFLVQCVQLAHQLWQAKEDRALLVAALANNKQLMEIYPRLDPEKRLGIVARVLRKFLPTSFETALEVRAAASVADKQRWITEYVESRRRAAGQPPAGELATRDFIGGATILMPFAGQDWWIVYDKVGWVPDASDGPDVIRVDVPKGFVTDLASVPSYLWTLLNKTGRYGNAAIYHDWLYWKQQELPDNTRAVADGVFERAMNDMGVDDFTRNLIWAGVRVFGGSYWDDNTRAKAAGERRVLKRFPDSPTITWEDWRQRPDVYV